MSAEPPMSTKRPVSTDRPTTQTDHLGLEVLTAEECWDLVSSSPVGRVAFVDAGEPLVFPVTHGVWCKEIVFRSHTGTKLGAAEMARALAFEVDGWEPDRRRGWSVLVRGVGATVFEDEILTELEALGIEPWLDAAADGTWVRIRADEISGRRIVR